MSKPQFIYSMVGVGKVVPPNRSILKDIYLSFFPDAKIGIIGANGAGKSSLLRIMAGVDRDHIGDARPAKGTSVGYLAQEPELDPEKDVRGNVEDGLGEARDLLNEFNEISAKFAEPMSDDEMNKLMTRQGAVQERIDQMGAWEIEHKLDVAMDALRCPPSDRSVTTLSGGEKRRVALCRLLLSQPDLLLLDEPTNHLDAESVAWLERHLKDYPGCVIAITHDRYFLDNVAGWILELDRGEGIPWQGNYSGWLDQKQQRLAVEEKHASARRKTLERELEWLRMAPRARQAKGKARISAYEELAAAEDKVQETHAEILIPPAPHLGEDVVIADDLIKAYGDQLVFENVSFRLPRGGIVGVIGPNGAGKSTLFRLIAGEEQADGGTLKIGKTVQTAYVDQSRDALDADKTVFEEISGGQDPLQFGKREINARAYCSWFGFRGADQQKSVGMLSGGERNRLHLAKLLKSGGNLLLLDEPTNDIDVDTLRALEDALLRFSGCIVVISHDRWFLDRIATHILAFEDDGDVRWFEGNYQEYAEDYRRRKGAHADQPHRLKHRKLTT